MNSSLEEDYESLVQFLYMAPIGLMQARLDGEILMVNPLCAQLLMPLSADGCLSNLFTALEAVAPDLRSRVAAFQPEQGTVCEALPLRMKLNPADRRAVRHLSLSLMKLDAGRLMVVLADVTQQVQGERELRQSQAWLQAIVTELTDYALVALDDSGCMSDWNASVERVTGHTRHSSEGRSCSLFFPPEALPPEAVLDRLAEAERSGWSLDEGWLLRANGQRFWGSCLIAPLHAPGEVAAEERAYCLVIRDVSERREAGEALRNTVSRDHLTGLANRRVLFDVAELEMQRWRLSPRPLALLMIDADHLRSIQDRHGQAAADTVLRHLATVLSAGFRAKDLVARTGGTGFMVLLPGAPMEGAAAVAQRLCESLAGQTVQVEGEALPCTVSVGVAAMDGALGDVDAFVARAEAALSAAQAQGRNRVVTWSAALQTRADGAIAVA